MTVKKKIVKQKVFLYVIFIIMLRILGYGFLYCNTVDKTPQDKVYSTTHREKVVITICVEKNSTLWDIAAEYYSEEYTDVNEMIEEIKMSNGIKKDTIHEGAYLIVPHYVSCE